MAEALVHNNFISEAKDGKTGLIYLDSTNLNGHEASEKNIDSLAKAVSFDSLSLREKTELKSISFNGNSPKGTSTSLEKKNPTKNKKAKRVSFMLNGNGLRLCHVENFSLFFLRSHPQQNKLIELTQSLTIHSDQYQDKLIQVTDPKINQLYLALVDKVWRRVQLVEATKKGLSEHHIQLTDFGTKRKIPQENLYSLGGEYKEIPPLVFNCALKNVSIQYLSREAKLKMNEWISEKLSRKSLTVDYYHKRSQDNISTLPAKKCYVDIYDDKGMHINGLARKEVEKLSPESFSGQETCSSLGRGSVSSNFYKKNEWPHYPNMYENPVRPFRNQYGRTHPPPVSARGSFPQHRSPLLQTPMQMSSPRDFSNTYPYSQSSPDQSLYADAEEKDRYIAQLRGQLRAYTNKMNSLENDSLTLTMLQDCIRLFYLIIKERDQLNKLLTENTSIQEAIDYLFSDKTFHSRYDDVLQLLDTMMMSSKKSWNYATKVDRLEDILRNDDLSSLKSNLETLIQNLKRHLSKEALQVLESKSAADKVFGLFVTPYTSISHNFLKWKKEYIESQQKTDGALEKVVDFFSNLGNYLIGLLHSSANSANETFPFSDLNLMTFQTACENEQALAKQECIEKVMVSLLEELDLRSKKIRRTEQSLKEVGLNSLFHPCSSDSSPPVTEDDYPTLVKFISQSRCMKASTKRLVVQDIVADVSQIHMEGKVYKHLNPQNILMNEGAKLRTTSEICIYEPLLPWKFQAPECSVENNGIGSPPVGQAADCFSLGQLMIWLACLNGNDDYSEKIKHYKAAIPLISSLLDHRPSYRPSVFQVREKMDDILPVLYGAEDANEELVNGVPGSPSKAQEEEEEEVELVPRAEEEEEVTPETISNCVRQESVLQSVLEEEEQILKELMDSEPEDN